ncbi:hypothetical protein IL306_011449 [Fusarium sp. DS 682]|nr:hypothetical protein IL306_011449 [Fusarium sp. DS 682]
MPSLRTIVLAVAASAVTVVNADYVIDPESVPLSQRRDKGDTKVNDCDPVSFLTLSFVRQLLTFCFQKTLTYGCICGDGKQPNVSEYSLTLPFYVCQEWGNQCVEDCKGSASCASDCRQNHPCGASNPKKYNTTSTATDTAAVKATASATDDSNVVFTDTPGGDGSDSSSTKTNSAAVIEAGRTWGLTIVLSTIFAGFAML